MISGTTAYVELRVRDARDAFGNDEVIYAAPQAVKNVLVVPGACKELDASRPEGVRVALTVHFPKGWTGGLRGARITLPAPWGGPYNVIGDPKPYMAANTPTPWNMPVEVEAVDG